ncbi:MAG: LysR family transcriptional regulator [Tabrizicola sp.]|nr:LysR family transcriptional regulator [Tabrizicola sp.]
MDWNNLHVLVAVAQEGSLAGAARVLGVNHATISRRIAALEAEVGAGLVRRLARSTPLTEKGRQIADLAMDMAARARQIEPLTKLQASRISGTVRLSAPPSMLSETLMPGLAGVLRAHPDLRLELVADSRITSLEQGEADIAIRLSEPQSPQIIARKLGEITYGLFGVAGHIEQPEAAWRFIGAGPDLAHSPAQTWLAAFAAGRPFSLMSSDPHVQKSAAEAGLGIALLPDRIAGLSPSLRRAQLSAPPARVAWLVMHPDVQNSPAVRIVAEAISSIFRSGG